MNINHLQAFASRPRPALGGGRPHLRAFDDKAQARGKTKLQVLVATIRQLVYAIYSTFKHAQLFRIAKVYA